jgi:hypothetical protein
MALIGRMLIIIFAVMLACLAAGGVIAMGLLGPQWHGFTGEVDERVVFWGATFIGATATGAAGLLPLVILIAIAESLKIRSLLAYAVGGAALLLLGFYASGSPGRYEESIDHPPPPISREAQIAAGAGIVFGLTYWAIAGRRAGRWRERRDASV